MGLAEITELVNLNMNNQQFEEFMDQDTLSDWDRFLHETEVTTGSTETPAQKESTNGTEHTDRTEYRLPIENTVVGHVRKIFNPQLFALEESELYVKKVHKDKPLHKTTDTQWENLGFQANDLARMIAPVTIAVRNILSEQGIIERIMRPIPLATNTVKVTGIMDEKTEPGK